VVELVGVLLLILLLLSYRQRRQLPRSLSRRWLKTLCALQ
jgi:hypothetical protein